MTSMVDINTVVRVSTVKAYYSCFFECNLLALNAEPQHVLSVGNIWVFLNEVYISRQQELPAPVDPRSCHMLQELLHILWRKLPETEGRTC